MTASGDPESVLLDLIAPVQARVGLEWAANRLTVAQEHAATAINERAIAALAHHTRPGPDTVPRGARVTVACVDGEWHALPARLLAEVAAAARLAGGLPGRPGAHPAPDRAPAPHRTGRGGPVLLDPHPPARRPRRHHRLPGRRRARDRGRRRLRADGRYARALGADAWAADASRPRPALAKGLDRPDPMAAHQTVDDLPHLADQEYTLVARTTHQLVKETLTELENRFPAMRRYAEEQRRRTAEDLAHIVEFLGTSLYVDDEDLFAGFILWTAGILTARRVPARSLDPALDLLAVQLKDFPRACRTLAHAREALRTRSTPAFTIPGPGKPA